jgi:hypothetical protein
MTSNPKPFEPVPQTVTVNGVQYVPATKLAEAAAELAALTAAKRDVELLGAELVKSIAAGLCHPVADPFDLPGIAATLTAELDRRLRLNRDVANQRDEARTELARYHDRLAGLDALVKHYEEQAGKSLALDLCVEELRAELEKP